jgi:uncharacterized RDD family membrane protein YckC
MSTIYIPTSFNISITFPAASFGRRLGAWLIDLALQITYLFFLSKIFSSFIIGENPFEESTERSMVQAVWLFLAVVPTFTYHPLCELLLNGQSIGKKITRLRVINDKGGRPSISQVMIRWIIRTSDFMMLMLLLMSAVSQNPQVFTQAGIAFGLLMLDIILVNVNARHQRLGDILAHTILIRTTQKTGIEETIFQHVTDTYVPQFPQVLQLSDRDINAVKNILDSAKKHHDYALAERAADKIRSHLRIENSMSPYDFLEILLKDYNYLTTH